MPKGEKVLAQSKRTAPPPNFKTMIFKLVSYCVQKGEKVAPSKIGISKPSWILRGEFIEGEFCLVKGKAFETGGENFKSWKCFAKSYSFAFDYLQTDFEKGFTKIICKNKTYGASMVQNVKNKETIHAYLIRIYIGSILSNLCT
jgi:hypothetical protein